MARTERAGPRSSDPAPATGPDTARLAVRLALPALAAGGGGRLGVTVRGRQGMALTARLDTDRHAVEFLNGLRGRYGPGPLRLRLAGRDIALLLCAEDAVRVLAQTPDPFSPPGSPRPHGGLTSTGPEREEGRALSENALETGTPLHHLAPRFVRTVREEAGGLLDSAAAHAGQLGQGAFGAAWWRAVRRVTEEDAARDGTALTGPADQVPRRMPAFDAAGTAAVRALALLATHPAQEQQVRNELVIPDLSRPQLLPYTRACVLESVRLWPTTPFLLRESTRQTRWGGGTLPAGTTFLVYAPFFHRDGSAAYGDRFVPEIWLDGTAHTGPALVPFGSGPGVCPGEDLALLLTSTLLAALMEHHDFRLHGRARLRPDGPLPYTLDHFALRFTATARH